MSFVQIGAVYTPPAQRGKGHARRAPLFASNPPAIAAYKAVELTQIGDWVLAIFKTPQVAP
ncbi:GNAT family N-acetyltransferase [Octadecabacter antarcticus]|uniref:GNAT family N-acetyltransferase n=1 Tax=Octadecabacter antarcticus TaxID=1217908 RepID=UPI0002E7330D|nr:hypothetical protein [Octadecabacter antarcticus]